MNRSRFLKTLGLLPIIPSAMKLNELGRLAESFNPSSKMPVWFIGHGNPMNALFDNAFTKSLNQMGKSLKEKPNAILVISAHWLTKGTFVSVSPHPETIYDFGGFPEALYHVKYPASGSPEYAKETKRIITSTSVKEDENWGLDHGAWTILKHLFPNADIPVFQLSIDFYQSPQKHFLLGQELKSLREKGVLIVGSGNIVHNLGIVDFSDAAKPMDWAVEFDEIVKAKINARLFNDLINYPNLGKTAAIAVPSNDHYLPMLYSLGLADNNEGIKFTFEEIQNGSISMRCFQVG